MQVFKVADGLFRGPRPSSFGELKVCAKAQVVFDLQYGIYEAFHNDSYKHQRKNAASYGVTFYNYRLSDFLPPSADALVAIVNSIEEYRTKGLLVYVHCKFGVDRTGLVIAAWRILYGGYTLEQAKKEMYDMGFHKWPYFFWVPVLKKLVKFVGKL